MKKFWAWLKKLLGIHSYPEYKIYRICEDTGLLAGPNCCGDIYEQRIKVGDAPTASCLHSQIDVCRVSGLLPSPACLTVSKCLLEAPGAICGVCKAYPADTPKPDWMPRMYVAWLSGHVLLPHYSNEQVRSFAEKISKAGVDYVRVMMCWDSPWDMPMVKPFLFGDEFFNANLGLPNPVFDDQLIRLRNILDPYHVRIHFDLFDNCDAEGSPWTHNVNGIKGIYDSSPEAKGRFFEWADRIMGILPADDGHRIGLGNELRYPNDDMSDEMKKWTLEIMLPLAEKLYMSGYLPVSVSAAPNTGHWLHGACSPDVSTKFGIRDFVLQIHGQGLKEDFDPNFGSDIRAYAYSDDGAQVKDPSKQGYCTKYPRCQATSVERAMLIIEWWKKYGEPRYPQRRMDHIEFLPGEISDGESPDKILPESLSVYNYITMKLWGIDITRK